MNIEKEMILESDNTLILSDWHIPFENTKLVNRALDVIKGYDVQHIIIPGDFMDCINFSTFKDEQPADTWDEEIEYVAKHLNKLESLIGLENVYFLRGNHEDRWIRAMFGRGKLKHLFNMTGVVAPNVSNFDWMTLHSPSGKWRICHPKNYSVIEGSVPKRLATKFRCNIASAHGHHCMQTRDVSRHYHAVELGGLFDQSKLNYLNRNTTTHPGTVNGFLHLLGDSVDLVVG